MEAAQKAMQQLRAIWNFCQGYIAFIRFLESFNEAATVAPDMQPMAVQHITAPFGPTVRVPVAP